MVASFKSVRLGQLLDVRVAVAGLVGSIALAAGPALANSSNADINVPLRAAQAERTAQNTGDADFRSLFATWRALDRSGGGSTISSHTSGFAAAATGGYATTTAGALTATSVTMPTTVSIPSRSPVESYKLTSEFGMRWHPVFGGRRPHKGVDLADPTGTPVHATADGVIERANWFAGYGLYVAIEHGGNIETRYGHMSRLNVAAGQMVHKGDIVGYVGRTGDATGPHLHYEVRIAGVPVNPMPYMEGHGMAAKATLAANLPAPAPQAAAGKSDGDE